MSCWPNAGASKRRIRNLTAETPPEPLGRYSDPSHIYESPRTLVRTVSSPIISRSHSASRPHRFVSLNSFISFFSAPSSAKLKGSGTGSRGLEIEVVKEEPELVETMMKGGSGGSVKKTYSVLPGDYQLLEEVGKGSSATVYRGMYIPYDEIVAVKCLDLDRCNSNLDHIKREAQTMSMIDHPNVVKGYCSFVVEHSLWLVMPFMAVGSCLHLMRVAYPDGFEEHVIGSILKETLKALEYLHKHGNIHRDVKAGNILLDSSGVVKLSDFGVTAGMFDMGDRQRSRNTFVGTPCWMAPEVMQPGDGYDFKADIWSFGITALELAHGHAPFSKHPPMKVLLMTLQNAPPGLDYDRDKKFSKSFKEMVAMCLVKDQTKRPTAEKLLKHSFFKNAKPPELSVKSLLADLPPLWDRVMALQRKDAEQLALKKMPSSEQDAVSMIEYQRAVSAWNFDIEDLKIQASLIVDDENIAEPTEDDCSLRINDKEPSDKLLSADKISDRQDLRDIEGPDDGGLIKKNEYLETDILEVITSIHHTEPGWKKEVGKKPQMCSAVLPPSVQNNSAKSGWIFERAESENELRAERSRCHARIASNLSDLLILPRHVSSNSLSIPTLSLIDGDSLEDMCKSNAVQIKGRFSVSSENIDVVKDSLRTRSASFNDFLSIPTQVVKAETTERERILLVKILELQARMISLTNELSAERLKHTQLQQQLSIAYSKRNGEKLDF